jgi:SAM-dependent methyltransferase
MKDAFGAARLSGHRSAGQRVRTVAQQDMLGSVKQLLSWVAYVHSSRQRRPLSLGRLHRSLTEWACAHYHGRMPTLPSARSGSRDHEPYQAREIAQSFGGDAERYDRARRRYPDALVERIVATSPGRQVLDVGCGTGIAARQFQAAGCSVLGVEPDTRMAQFARQTRVEVEVATFEAWDPAGRLFDAIIGAQAWHWVNPVVGPAKAAQLLRPRGRLAVFGQVFEAPPEVATALADIYQRVAPDSPVNPPASSAQSGRTALELYEAMFAKAADDIRQTSEFDEPEQWRFPSEQSYTRDQWLDQLLTTGLLTQLPPNKLAEVVEYVGAAIDTIGGSFTMPHTTLATTATRARTT